MEHQSRTQHLAWQQRCWLTRVCSNNWPPSEAGLLSHAGAHQYSMPLFRDVCASLAELYGYLDRCVVRDLACQLSCAHEPRGSLSPNAGDMHLQPGFFAAGWTGELLEGLPA